MLIWASWCFDHLCDTQPSQITWRHVASCTVQFFNHFCAGAHSSLGYRSLENIRIFLRNGLSQPLYRWRWNPGCRASTIPAPRMAHFRVVAVRTGFTTLPSRSSQQSSNIWSSKSICKFTENHVKSEGKQTRRMMMMTLMMLPPDVSHALYGYGDEKRITAKHSTVQHSTASCKWSVRA